MQQFCSFYSFWMIIRNFSHFSCFLFYIKLNISKSTINKHSHSCSITKTIIWLIIIRKYHLYNVLQNHDLDNYDQSISLILLILQYLFYIYNCICNSKRHYWIISFKALMANKWKSFDFMLFYSNREQTILLIFAPTLS